MYPVDLHMHTVASTHAYSTVHDYLAEAVRRGVKLIAITDHGPEMVDAPHAFHFTNMRILPRLVDGVGILRGIEANIKANGNTDCSEKMRASLDLIIAGFHKQVFAPAGKIANTDTMIAAMASGHVHIISHPGNPESPVDIPSIVEAAAHFNVALEVNNSSFTYSRRGSDPNCRTIVAAVRERGGWLSLGTDSHSAFTLGDFTECQKILDDECFLLERVLNVSPRRVLDFLASHGMSPIEEFAGL
ncbi:putative hydrolase|uniref:Putative hydrolase n=1 Tax=Brenneria salicis ATCC 15712 = DSM 30166 TaxID=714314 RepID=A0A366I1Y2_9GAMM|nr:phosphatase [Brenneria salicis]NMN92064.1 putative hydrolase [Brenneria salicis ATCC 15712 = DSM 30166]RBP61187.1 putative hydrolase [Brenneria salicis ATCC 15712 = DSM 30166]RLM30207.1 phosphatase [Brenneria salicis ATCC 15712 = DSM 30166]